MRRLDGPQNNSFDRVPRTCAEPIAERVRGLIRVGDFKARHLPLVS